MTDDVLVPADYGLSLDWHHFPVLLTETDRHALDQEFDEEEEHL